MGRKPCCEKVGLKQGPWTSEEDQKLVAYITTSGLGCWRAIPKLAGLLRCGKSCRLRWTNYLRPDLKRGIFTEEEENLVLDLHATLGNRWSRIAAQLPGRTDNEIKNYWNTRLKKRLSSQGLDPATHLPLVSSKLDGNESNCADGEDGDESSDASGSKSEKKLAAKAKQQVKPVRQPRGPKPALPQLKMCRSEEGLVLRIKVPKTIKLSPKNLITTPGAPPASCKGDDDQHSELSSSSTVTTKSGADDGHHESSLACKLITSLPSCPEDELWKSITSTTISSPPSSTTTTTATQFDTVGMDQMDHNVMNFTSHPPSHDYVGENLGTIFSGSCFAQPEMWNVMDVDMCQPAPDSLFAPTEVPTPINPAEIYHREMQQPGPHQQSPDLQRLAAILDLI